MLDCCPDLAFCSEFLLDLRSTKGLTRNVYSFVCKRVERGDVCYYWCGESARVVSMVYVIVVLRRYRSLVSRGCVSVKTWVVVPSLSEQA